MSTTFTKAPSISRDSSRKLKVPTKHLGIQLPFVLYFHLGIVDLLLQQTYHEDRAVWTALDARNQSICGVIVLPPAPLTTPGPFSPPLAFVGHLLDSPTRAEPFPTRDSLPFPLSLWLLLHGITPCSMRPFLSCRVPELK